MAEKPASGADYAERVADALLAVLDGGSPTLPDDNPYANVIRQVLAALGRDDV